MTRFRRIRLTTSPHSRSSRLESRQQFRITEVPIRFLIGNGNRDFAYSSRKIFRSVDILIERLCENFYFLMMAFNYDYVVFLFVLYTTQ